LTQVARDVTLVVSVFVLDNAGRGGSLDKDGQVVCEASIATTEGRKVCAVVGTTTVQNPVKLCKALTEHEEIIKLTRGREFISLYEASTIDHCMLACVCHILSQPCCLPSQRHGTLTPSTKAATVASASRLILARTLACLLSQPQV